MSRVSILEPAPESRSVCVRRENRVRVAIGAQPNDIVGLVLRQAGTVVCVGLLVGLTVTLVAAESLSKNLYGIAAYDALSFAIAPLVIVLVALVACIVPARRAARLDPVQVLRSHLSAHRVSEPSQ